MMSTTNAAAQPPLATWRELSFRVFAAVAGALCLAGFLIRLYSYGHYGTLWLDEAMLSVAVRDASWRQLFGALPYYDQAAPLLYLLLSKLLFVCFGVTHWIARLLPFLTGIMALGVALGAPGLSRLERVAFVFFIAFNVDLLRYSAEAKQYGPEALASLLFYVASKRLAIEPSSRSMFLYLLIGIACIASITLFPVILIASVSAIAFALWRHPMRWRVAAVVVLLCVAYATYYFLVFRPSIVYQTLNYSSAYVSDPALQGKGVLIFFRRIKRIFQLEIGLSLASVPNNLLLALFLVSLFRRSWWNFETVALSALYAALILLNIFHVVPLGSRRWFVFLIPWAAAFGAVAIARLPRIVALAAAALFAASLIYEVGAFIVLLPLWDSHRTLSYIESHGGMQDVAVSMGTQPIFDFYYAPFGKDCIREQLLEHGFVNRCTARNQPFPTSLEQVREAAARPGIWGDFTAATVASWSEDVRNGTELRKSGFTQLSVDYRADLLSRHAGTPQLLAIELEPDIWVQWLNEDLTRRGMNSSIVVNERNGRGREQAAELLLIKAAQ